MSTTDWKALLDAAKDQGWAIERDRRHIVLYGPSGQTLTLPSSPGRGRAYANCIALFRRSGGVFQGRGGGPAVTSIRVDTATKAAINSPEAAGRSLPRRDRL